MAEQQCTRTIQPRLVYNTCTLDAPYAIRRTHETGNGCRNGMRCPVFAIWNALARRCYSDEYKANHPECANWSMCPEWRDSFMAFRRWLIAQPGWESGVYVKLRDGQNEYSPGTVYLSPPDRRADAPSDWRNTRLPFQG